MTYLILAVIFIVLGTIFLFLWKRYVFQEKLKARKGYDDDRDVATRTYGLMSTAFFAMFFLWSGCNMLTIVQPGTTAIGVFLGNVQQREYGEGLHFVNPMLSFARMSVRREIVDFHSGKSAEQTTGDEVTAVSSNNLQLFIDVTYPYKLNPRYAWWVYQNIGYDERYREQLIKTAARNATRNATAHYTPEEATTTKREELALSMEQQFRTLLIADMVKQGLSDKAAEEVFTVLPVQLRKVLPPDKVLNSIAEKESALQDLQRQTTLTEIAQQQALRRANEGLGVKKLFDNLPSNFTPQEIGLVLEALATKERGDAMMKAVETGQVQALVFEGGNHVNLPPRAGK